MWGLGTHDVGALAIFFSCMYCMMMTRGTCID